MHAYISTLLYIYYEKPKHHAYISIHNVNSVECFLKNCMSRSGIYYSYDSLLIADMLNAEEMAKTKDLTDFNKGQNIMAR